MEAYGILLNFMGVALVFSLGKLIYDIGKDRGRQDLLKEKRTELFNDIVKITIEYREDDEQAKKAQPEIIFINETE